MYYVRISVRYEKTDLGRIAKGIQVKHEWQRELFQ